MNSFHTREFLPDSSGYVEGNFDFANSGHLTNTSDFTGIHPRAVTGEETPFVKNGMNVLKADGRVLQR